jgi:hypothetical protein
MACLFTCYLTFVRIGRFAYTKIEKVAYELQKTVYNFPRFLLSLPFSMKHVFSFMVHAFMAI